MKVSYKWLQEYIEDTLPPVDEVVSALTMHSFEIESVEEMGGDKILDVKILPNRSHDCLSHYGISMEIASVCGLARKPLLPAATCERTNKLDVSIGTELCGRTVKILIEGIKISESPEWLKEKLKMMGHRSINNIVDITNYLTYCFGQPMHAFDARKIAKNKKGANQIFIRMAKKDEKITLLNGIEYTLDPNVIVIADSEKALDVAGVMGGKESAVQNDTTDIILSFSQFDAVSVRKTSKRLGVRTDASQRFENDISPALVDRVLPYALQLIFELAGGEVVGGLDVYPRRPKQTVISTTVEKISRILGVELDAEKIISLLAKQEIQATAKGDSLTVLVPLPRLDLSLPEDIAEEVGRLYGYENIFPLPLPPSKPAEVSKTQYAISVIRNTLVSAGFSEIYTYSLVPEGDIEIENPLANDKNFLRRNLADAMAKAMEQNFKFLDFLSISEIKLFEIGIVFSKKGETLHLSLGVKYPKSKKLDQADEEISRTIHTLEGVLGVSVGDVSIIGGLAEIDIVRLTKQMDVPETYPKDIWDTNENVSYKPISPYPYAVRDVAVFVPNDFSVERVMDAVKPYLTNIVARFFLFDTFQKGDRTSYAFRLIFQSREKTLTDAEINAVMDPIYDLLRGKEGFEIR